MKIKLDSSQLPSDSLFVTCSSHEERCLGVPRNLSEWRPQDCIVFHYDDPNPRREINHAALLAELAECRIAELVVSERDAVRSLQAHRDELLSLLVIGRSQPIVIDVSVFTKRHLLMLLRWLDDHDCWDRLWIVYSEPDEYEIEGQLPLSFGVSCIEQIAGFPASPDPSRPLHVAMFLGYEGDRALATYEALQPRRTTLIIPDPPFRDSWRGRTETQNRNLLAVVDHASVTTADALDPESSFAVLKQCLGLPEARSELSRAVCLFGTKPQLFGAYQYLRLSADSPAVIYTGTLRHNHTFYSRGVGASWLIHHSG